MLATSSRSSVALPVGVASSELLPPSASSSRLGVGLGVGGRLLYVDREQAPALPGSPPPFVRRLDPQALAEDVGDRDAADGRQAPPSATVYGITNQSLA